MAITSNREITKDEGWVEIASDPLALSMTANTPGIWYIAVTEDSIPSSDVYGERMGDHDSYLTGSITGNVYLRVVSAKGIKFGITKEE